MPPQRSRRDAKPSKFSKPKASSQPEEPATQTAKKESTGSVFFWREYGNEYGYLSQWYRSPFTAEDFYPDEEKYEDKRGKIIVFSTAEQ
jgi:hypothetical protein